MATVRTINYTTAHERFDYSAKKRVVTEQAHEIEISANVWEKGDARIVYFNVGGKKIAAWDIVAQTWKSVPTGEHKQAAEAKAEALKATFGDLMEIPQEVETPVEPSPESIKIAAVICQKNGCRVYPSDSYTSMGVFFAEKRENEVDEVKKLLAHIPGLEIVRSPLPSCESILVMLSE